jgi:hypothetical protein
MTKIIVLTQLLRQMFSWHSLTVTVDVQPGIALHFDKLGFLGIDIFSQYISNNFFRYDKYSYNVIIVSVTLLLYLLNYCTYLSTASYSISCSPPLLLLSFKEVGKKIRHSQLLLRRLCLL